MIIKSKSVDETKEVARGFLEKISKEINEGALVVGLYGDLGSGKTTFTQAIAKHLGVQGDITSPTFVIEKIYPIGESDLNSSTVCPFKNLVHIDAYRLDSPKELEVLSWKETCSDPKNLIFIEWPERVSDILPVNHAKIKFKFLSENEREIEI